MRIVSFSEGHSFLWMGEIYSLVFLFSFIFLIQESWMRHATTYMSLNIQKICKRDSSHRGGQNEINSFETHKNLKPFKRHPRLSTTILLVEHTDNLEKSDIWMIEPQRIWIIPSEMEVAPHPQNSWYHTEHKTFYSRTRTLKRLKRF